MNDGTSPPLSRATGDAGQTRQARRAHILLTDSVELNRDLTGMMLRHLGHSVEAAVDRQDALARIDRSLVTRDHYDLILIDTQMTGGGAPDVTRALRSCEPYARTPIVGLTVNVLADDLAASLAAGLDIVLHSPVRVAELAMTIDMALASAAADPLGNENRLAARTAEPRSDGSPADHAKRRAEILARIDALVGGGDFAPQVLEEIVDLAYKLAAAARISGDPATGDLAYALEQCVRGVAAGGAGAIRQAAASAKV